MNTYPKTAAIRWCLIGLTLLTGQAVAATYDLTFDQSGPATAFNGPTFVDGGDLGYGEQVPLQLTVPISTAVPGLTLNFGDTVDVTVNLSQNFTVRLQDLPFLYMDIPATILNARVSAYSEQMSLSENGAPLSNPYYPGQENYNGLYVAGYVAYPPSSSITFNQATFDFTISTVYCCGVGPEFGLSNEASTGSTLSAMSPSPTPLPESFSLLLSGLVAAGLVMSRTRLRQIATRFRSLVPNVGTVRAHLRG
jgi:hypothetical protein